MLGVANGVCAGDDVHPGSFGQFEPIAAERTREGGGTVDPVLRQERPELADEHAQRLVPGRRRMCSPEGLCKLVARYRPALLRDEVREQQPSLPAVEAPLVAYDSVALRRDATRQENLQLILLPGSCRDFAAI